MRLSAANLEEMVVKRKRISRRLVAVVLVLVAVIPASYHFGTQQTGSLPGLASQAELLQTENLVLQREVADLRLAKEVESGTGENLRSTIKALRGQIAETNEELKFYRDLMAPSANQKGLRIEKLSLEKSADADRFEYRLMLTQLADRRSWVQGTVNVDVIGELGGRQQVLALTDFGLEQAYPFNFKFRYFQDFTGILTLPEKFTPSEVMVTAISSGKRGKRLQRRFDWDEVTR